MKASGIIHYYESTPQTCAASSEKAFTPPPPANVNIINPIYSKSALSCRIERPHSKLQQPAVRTFCVCTFPYNDSLI